MQDDILEMIDILPEDDYIEHYGRPHEGLTPHSGRYEYGSGKDAYQRATDWISEVKKLRAQGMSNNDIARAMGLTTTEWRALNKIAGEDFKAGSIRRVKAMKDHGYSNTTIAEKLGITEGTVRQWLKKSSEEDVGTTTNLANQLKDALKDKTMIDIGAGVELGLGVSDTKLKAAVQLLKEEGYNTYEYHIQQIANPDQYTTMKVLAPPDMTFPEGYKRRDEISLLDNTLYTVDGGKTFYSMEYPTSIDGNRVFIRYGDQGGSDLDGTIQIRRGLEDLNLGDKSYAQVRILVNGDHYMKGMALYSDDVPEGYDIIYNTNKKTGTDFNKVLKEIKDDESNPFGASLRTIKGQNYYENDNGDYAVINGKMVKVEPGTGTHSLNAVNIMKMEGDWAEYAKTVSSQMLSKQKTSLIQKQLDATLKDKMAEFEEIKSLTNNEVRKFYLESFADDCDSSASDLKAVAFPRQSTQVILPIPSLKDDEIYAPNYRDGETVALIRYPHGGTFEIPILKVNNKQKDAKKVLGQAEDAVGINSKVAERLSGADFDGDTVTVIPTNSNVKINSKPALEALKNFNTKDYAYTEEQLKAGAKVLTEQNKQREMGIASNLITDMTIQGAPDSEIARAVKYSMVVIDAPKHKLDYKACFEDCNIRQLKQEYQKKDDDTFGGSSTLISKSSSEARVPERKPGAYVTDKEGNVKKMYIDPETGKKLYTETGREYIDEKTGKTIKAITKTTAMDVTDDAFKLSSGTVQEAIYAKYANNVKKMANEARKLSLEVPRTKYSPESNKTYKKEVESLDAKLLIAKKNAPLERQAQLVANIIYEAKLRDNPNMSKDEKKKIKTQELNNARARVGASKKSIVIEDKEWEAIQSGAISSNKLSEILRNSDTKVLRQKAMPRTNNSISQSKQLRIQSLAQSGHTSAEIADYLGISVTTVNKYKNGGE